MALKKKKVSKKLRRQILNVAIPAAIIMASVLIGAVGSIKLSAAKKPANLVWAADNTVSVPDDLKKFLSGRQSCREYRGTGTPTGVGLWGVFQVSQNRFAKIAYGCSWHLSTYIMAVKQEKNWQLIKPTEYFAPFGDGGVTDSGALPFCAQLDKYKIPKEIESFCIDAEGKAKSNEL